MLALAPADVFAHPAFQWVGIPAAALLAFMYLAAPLIVRSSHWQSREPRVLPRDPARGEADAFFDSVFPALADAGFRETCRFLFADFTPNVTTEICMMTDRARGVMAVGMLHFVTKAGQTRPHTRSLEFTTTFEDGRSFNTLRSTVVMPWTEIGLKRMYEVPGVADPLRLLAVHEAIVRADGEGRRAKDPPLQADLPEKMCESIARDLDEQIRWGWLHRDPGSPRCLLTLRGAYILTWQQLWPMSRLRRGKRAWRERRLLERLGVGEA
ncbi:MAG: hypothetical protein HYY18_19835 [Planctomycetes bacterium]|nr:hypothetical protein [Planctomycetota bacterium]